MLTTIMRAHVTTSRFDGFGIVVRIVQILVRNHAIIMMLFSSYAVFVLSTAATTTTV